MVGSLTVALFNALAPFAECYHPSPRTTHSSLPLPVLQPSARSMRAFDAGSGPRSGNGSSAWRSWAKYPSVSFSKRHFFVKRLIRLFFFAAAASFDINYHRSPNCNEKMKEKAAQPSYASQGRCGAPSQDEGHSVLKPRGKGAGPRRLYQQASKASRLAERATCLAWGRRARHGCSDQTGPRGHVARQFHSAAAQKKRKTQCRRFKGQRAVKDCWQGHAATKATALRSIAVHCTEGCRGGRQGVPPGREQGQRHCSLHFTIGARAGSRSEQRARPALKHLQEQTND